MQSNRITKFFKWIVAFMSPPVILVLIYFGLSFIGVYIESDGYLLLIGGFENVFISFVIFLISNLLLWILLFFIKAYRRVLHKGYWSILFVIIEIFLLHLAIIGYYLIIFVYLTGLNPIQIDIKLISTLQQDLLLIIGGFSLVIIFTSVISNILLYRLHVSGKSSTQKNDEENHTNASQPIDTNSGSNFDNMIST